LVMDRYGQVFNKLLHSFQAGTQKIFGYG